MKWLVEHIPETHARLEPSETPANSYCAAYIVKGELPEKGWKRVAEVPADLTGSILSGRLAPERIQQVVRSQFVNFRKCYEQGLVRNPNLKGAINIEFTIARDGSTQNVAINRTDLPDCQVVRCVADAFTWFTFPKPEGGVVNVVYPIMLAPR